MKKHFYTTVNLSTKELEYANARAIGQEDLIKEIFKANPKTKISPSQMQEIFSKKYKRNHPITSIRRAMTNLTYATHGSILRKTEEQVKGEFGLPEHLWELNELSSDEELQKFWDDFQSGKLEGVQQPNGADCKPGFIQPELFG